MSRDGNLIFHEQCHPRGRCDRETTARRRRHVGTVANWGLAAQNILKCELPPDGSYKQIKTAEISG